MEIPEMLKYKYLVSMEGVDVGTNLKWILNSNSVCFKVKETEISSAAIFFIMDISGSMSTEKKYIARSFFFLL